MLDVQCALVNIFRCSFKDRCLRIKHDLMSLCLTQSSSQNILNAIFLIQISVQMQKEYHQDNTFTSFKYKDLEYERKIGQFQPSFKGKPETYYELSWGEVCSALSVCFLIVVIMFFLCVGFFFWTHNVSTSNFALTWSIVFAIFIPLFLIFAYFGSRSKVEIEEEMIKQALNKLEEGKKNKNGKATKKVVLDSTSIELMPR